MKVCKTSDKSFSVLTMKMTVTVRSPYFCGLIICIGNFFTRLLGAREYTV